ncbi:energy-coupling factor ABC transporter ATP-binding protein [Paucilactobacillus kaifaensis]|uniref:energy-coupling factor ABC transporter ATP-binding protein n=1 Tax=Paucilactobacillus kaifaensis TaxID=2559921 RepID=UPI0010F74C28|nr:energy-coupling factor ABC transporter ATP-binding protein [Paucilactobacillus kaifaensis]
MTAIIRATNISYHYPDETNDVIHNLSFEIKRGDWVAIVGHNGSGKSTLARAIDGLLELDQGEIFVNDQLVAQENIWEIRKQIGFVFQNPDNQFVGATVADDVAFGLENRHMPRNEMIEKVNEALEMVEMSQFAEREPAALSGGQKQRVALAGVVAMRPDILILDEATSMLDPEGRESILKLLQQLRQRYHLTVISITHDIDEAAMADEILLIDDGRLVAKGVPNEILMQGDRLIELGLDVPYGEKIKRALVKEDLQTPTEYMDSNRMVDWLWQKLNLTK